MAKKNRENVYHVNLTNAGTDTDSLLFKRTEDTNPAALAVRVVSLLSKAFVGTSDDVEKERRNFFLSVGVSLLKMSSPDNKALDIKVEELLDQWKLLLNEWEQDDETFNRKYEDIKKEIEGRDV